jgi:hypothetical protein
MGSVLKSLLLGFIAGAIAMVTVHELISQWLYIHEFSTRIPWSLEPSTLTGYPQIATDAVLGGAWGCALRADPGRRAAWLHDPARRASRADRPGCPRRAGADAPSSRASPCFSTRTST